MLQNEEQRIRRLRLYGLVELSGADREIGRAVFVVETKEHSVEADDDHRTQLRIHPMQQKRPCGIPVLWMPCVRELLERLQLLPYNLHLA
jgi:hypothetical protein